MYGKRKAEQVVVAPPAGAWIETHVVGCSVLEAEVAPPAGAWIETKQQAQLATHCPVAPHAGAWIETLTITMDL